MLVPGQAVMPNTTSFRLVLLVFNDKVSLHQGLQVVMFVTQVTFLSSIASGVESLLLDGKTGRVVRTAAETLECPVSSGSEGLRDCKTFKLIRRLGHTSQTSKPAFVSRFYLW